MCLMFCVCVCYQSLTAHQHQKGHTVPKTGDNDSNVNSSHYSLSIALVGVYLFLCETCLVLKTIP